MAKPTTIKTLKHCKVSPPPNSVPTASIPLTFFDIPWLFFPPNQPLFFYEYHHSTSHFLSTTLPILKHSLSLTLQHFFPFAGNLILPSESKKPRILFTQNGSVSLTVSESNADFNYLTGNHPRNINDFHSLVPELKASVTTVNEVIPLLAVQVTVFPYYGVGIGLAYHHAVADARTFNHFIKTWSALCRNTDEDKNISFLPSLDRTLIIDTNGLEEIFFNEWSRKKLSSKQIIMGSRDMILSDMVRATLVVGLNDMERIKRWIINQCKKKKQAIPVHLSPYVLTCSFLWPCLAKSSTTTSNHEDPIYFGFNAGGITRLDYPVPTSYFGNCIGFGRSMTMRDELLGEDGIIVAANAIGNTIKKLDRTMFSGADKWISDWEVLFGSSDLHVMVFGSPKVDLYDTDFGWGRPKKIEEISIDRVKAAISLSESRDMEGGIEVGLALPNLKMEVLISLFNRGLNLLP